MLRRMPDFYLGRDLNPNFKQGAAIRHPLSRLIDGVQKDKAGALVMLRSRRFAAHVAKTGHIWGTNLAEASSPGYAKSYAASPSNSGFKSGFGKAGSNNLRSSEVMPRPKASLKVCWNCSNDICGWPLIVINI